MAQATATVEQPADATTVRQPQPRATVLRDASGNSQPDRVMRVDFAGFSRTLIQIGEPSPEDARALASGMDLLSALEACSDDFGAAAPGASEEATLAERVGALTDEAFDVAAGVLEDHEAAEGGGGVELGQLTARLALRRAMSDAAFDNLLGASIRTALLELGSRPDPSVGLEFV